MAKLYDLVGDMDILYELMQDESYCDEDGVINPDFLAMLDGTSKDIKTKALNTAKVIKQLWADHAMIGTEREKLQTRENRIKKNAEWLKNYLCDCLIASGMTDKPIADSQAEIRFRKSQVVEITGNWDSESSPYKRITPAVVSPDKTAIGNAIKRGEEVIGAYLVDKLNIQLR